jgi:hypothetical protein
VLASLDSNIAWWFFNNAMSMALATNNKPVAEELARDLHALVNSTIDPDGSMPKELLYAAQQSLYSVIIYTGCTSVV